MAVQARPHGAVLGPVFDLGDAPANLLVSNLAHQQQAGLAHHQHQHLLACPPVAAAPTRAAAAAPTQQREQHHGMAARLNEQLHSLDARGAMREAVAGPDAGEGRLASATEASLRSRAASFALRVGDMLQPYGEAPGDATWGERTANVLTSLPFLALGWHMHRQRLTPEGRHHARSMAAVGIAATVYHASSGRARRIARKVDYWAIAYTSSAMTRALFADSAAVRCATRLSLLAVPFRPFAVSTANTLIMQAEFARQAAKHKAVRADLRRHYAAALLGVAAFFGEDLVADTGYGGFVHSAWHCLAAYSMHTIDGLLAHKERQLLRGHLSRQQQQSRSTPKPLRRPLHSSASSLPSYGGACGGKSPGTATP